MYKITRCTQALGAVIVAVVGLAACGGSGMPGDTVVQVGGSSITKATLDHWTSVEAILAYDTNPKQPVPKGVVPVPPSYTACIAYLEATAPKSAKGQSKLTAAQLKSQCQQHYEELQQHILGILINFDWLAGESADQGIKVTDEEVKRQFTRFKHEQFRTEAAFQRFLGFTGESLSDELLIMKRNLLTEEIAQKVIEKKGLTAQQQQQAGKAFVKKWTARTNCRAGYVVPGCKQYKGPQSLI